ncbi:MAG: hypothetical protein LKE43_11150 [Olsenella sp.]|jgi:hypothetical protein|nr:hypothetical protein [Olsenella sp.]
MAPDACAHTAGARSPRTPPPPHILAHEEHFLLQSGSHILRLAQAFLWAQSFLSERLRLSSRETLVASTPSPSAIQAGLLPSTTPFSISLRISRVRWA